VRSSSKRQIRTMPNSAAPYQLEIVNCDNFVSAHASSSPDSGSRQRRGSACTKRGSSTNVWKRAAYTLPRFRVRVLSDCRTDQDEPLSLHSVRWLTAGSPGSRCAVASQRPQKLEANMARMFIVLNDSGVKRLRPTTQQTTPCKTNTTHIRHLRVHIRPRETISSFCL
jgi:hypothetical protein